MRRVDWQNVRNHRRGGFTLLELLVVVAILTIVAGGLIASYDGLQVKSSQGVATYDIAALDGALRNFNATNNGQYPNELDSLLFDPSTAAQGDETALNILPTNLKGDGNGAAKLGPYQLTAEGVAALRAVGITTARYVAGDLSKSYDNSPPRIDGGTGTQPEVPNRVFDDPLGAGWGIVEPLEENLVVAAVENLLQDDFDGVNPGDSHRLNEMAGLDPSVGHVVVAFGVGNNSTLVQSVDGRTDARSASLSQAPYYKNIPPERYGRYVALFHLASDDDASGTIGDSPGEFRGRARLVGVIDTRGDWYEEEEAEYTGVKE